MDKILEFSHLTLSKEQVDSFSVIKKKRLLMLTNILRDMNLLRKLMIYTKQQDLTHKNFAEASFVSVAFTIVKLLTSKVYEAWNFLRHEKIGEERGIFSESLRESWQGLDDFFANTRNEKLFSFIRNKFGFHYDHFTDLEPYIERALSEVGDLDFWMSTRESGNDVFAYSGTVMLIALRDKMRELGFEGSEETLVGDLQRLPVEVSHMMNEFCKGYLVEIILDGLTLTEKEKFSVSAPLLSEVTLPLITKNDIVIKGTVLNEL